MKTATTLITALIILSSAAWAGEIHDAVRVGNLEKVKALLEKDPKLVSSACVHAHTLNAAVLSMQFDDTGSKEIEIPKKYRTPRLEETVPGGRDAASVGHAG